MIFFLFICLKSFRCWTKICYANHQGDKATPPDILQPYSHSFDDGNRDSPPDCILVHPAARHELAMECSPAVDVTAHCGDDSLCPKSPAANDTCRIAVYHSQGSNEVAPTVPAISTTQRAGFRPATATCTPRPTAGSSGTAETGTHASRRLQSMMEELNQSSHY